MGIKRITGEPKVSSEVDAGAQIDHKRVAEQPWLAKQWAGQAEAPGHLSQRAELLVALSLLPLKKQAVSISACFERDKLVEHLMDQDEYGALLNLLHSDLARWLPDSGEFSDLKWLLAVLLQVKKQSFGKKARVVLHTPAGTQVRESAAMLEALVEDALGAAAAAWVRCLCGPGGDHRVLEMPLALADRELAEFIFMELARDPRALALLMEDVRSWQEGAGLEQQQLLVLLRKGARAAQFCHETIMAGINNFT